MNKKNKIAIHTLGCKVNSYESDAMCRQLVLAGYEIVPFDEIADIYIINTCTVTNIADRKSRQMLHRARRMNENAVVVAVGCYAQVCVDEAFEDKMVDIIIGNNRKHEIVDILSEYTGNKLVVRSELNTSKVEYETLSISKTAEHTRAYIKIQDGCNQFCSYCLIPFARGRIRSRKSADIIKEVDELKKNGYREIVLTGIHISSYGSDFEGEAKDKALLRLLEQLNAIKGIDRIRLGSLEPMIMKEDFVREISGLEKICPHFHLSLQSGAGETLKRMNRKYTPDEYRASCEYVNKYFKHPAITTDVIVGFPGETDEEFMESKNFIDSIEFFETHIFKYSRRKGTRAAAMDNQVDERIKTKRSGELIELGNKNTKKFMKYYIGKSVEVLMEEELLYNGEKYFTGHTREYLRVAVKTDENISNQLVCGTIEGFLSESILLLKKD